MATLVSMTMYVGGGGGTGNVGKHYEQLIAKLMESGGDPSKYDLKPGSIVYFFLKISSACYLTTNA